MEYRHKLQNLKRSCKTRQLRMLSKKIVDDASQILFFFKIGSWMMLS